MRLGDWIVYCDICGQKCYASTTSQLPADTGRGGLVVCRHDADAIDYGIIPYKIPLEKNVPYTRVPNTNLDNSYPIVNPETMTYDFYLASSQDSIILMTSQSSDWLIVSEPV